MGANYYGDGQNAGLGDLVFSALRKPLLSAREIRSWPEKGASIVRETGDSCVIAYGDPADTSWVYTIDRKTNLIIGLDLHNKNSARDTVLLNTWYVYQDTAGVHVPRLMALRADTTLMHGGYRFSNFHINDSIPDSLFILPNRIRNKTLFKQGVFAFAFHDDVLSLGFPTLTRLLRVQICAISGRILYSGEVSPGTDRFVWKGESSLGRKLPAGKYIVHLNGENIHFSRGFSLE